MQVLQWVGDLLVESRSPVMVAAFAGWNDAASAATTALEAIAVSLEADPVAEIDPEDFYDFQVTRPTIRMAEGEPARSTGRRTASCWPARPGAERDFVLLTGVEPHLRWRTFTEIIADVMREVGASTSITLGAQPAGVPHTRALPLNLSASHTDFEDLFGLKAPASRYQGPTGIVGIVHGLPPPRLAHGQPLGGRPPLLAAVPNPKAALALLRRAPRASPGSRSRHRSWRRRWSGSRARSTARSPPIPRSRSCGRGRVTSRRIEPEIDAGHALGRHHGPGLPASPAPAQPEGEELSAG